MDKFEQIAEHSQHSAAILGHRATGNYTLMDLRAPLTAEAFNAARAQAMCFCGVIGLIDGALRVVLDAPIAADSIAALTQAFLRRITVADGVLSAHVDPKDGDDFVSFAESLWSLEDPRADA